MRFTVVQLKAFFSHNLKLYKWYLLRKVHWYKNAVVILTKYGYYFTVVTAILLGCSNWAHFVCSTVILKTKTTIMLAKLARLFTHLLQINVLSVTLIEHSKFWSLKANSHSTDVGYWHLFTNSFRICWVLESGWLASVGADVSIKNVVKMLFIHTSFLECFLFVCSWIQK